MESNDRNIRAALLTARRRLADGGAMADADLLNSIRTAKQYADQRMAPDPRLQPRTLDPNRASNRDAFLAGNHVEVPDVVYHGTSADFSEVLPFTHFGTNTASNHILGHYDEKSLVPSQNQHIMPVHLSMKNPLYMGNEFNYNPRYKAKPGYQDYYISPVDPIYHAAATLRDKGTPDAAHSAMLLRNLADRIAADTGGSGSQRVDNLDQMKHPLMQAAAKVLNQAGYDGLAYKNAVEDPGSMSFIALSPHQVKSATGNIGAYDTSNPDITRAAGGRIGRDFGGYIPMQALQRRQLVRPAYIPTQDNPGVSGVLGSIAGLGDTASALMGNDTQQPVEASAATSTGTSPGASAAASNNGISPQAQAAYDALKASWTSDTPFPEMISGYRDPQHNADVGGAKGSQHIHGNAFDFDTHGWTPEQKLAYIEAAKAAGFTGFGIYDNNLHFDVGPSRYWGPDYHSGSAPGWFTSSDFYTNTFAPPATRANGGGVADLGEVREKKQLQGFHTKLQSDIRDAVSGARGAYQKAAEAGLFEGYEPGSRFLGKTGNGPQPLQITGHFMREWKPTQMTLQHFARSGATPTLVEHEGKTYVPMVRMVTGVKDDPVNDWSESDAYLDTIKARGYPKMGGLRSAFAEGGRAIRAALLVAKRAKGGRTTNDMGLYSHAAEVLSKIAQEKGTAEQYIAMLKKAGVKDTELEYAGPLPTGPITRDNLIQHFKRKVPNLQVTRYGDEPPVVGYGNAEIRRLRELRDREYYSQPGREQYVKFRDTSPLSEDEQDELARLSNLSKAHQQREMPDDPERELDPTDNNPDTAYGDYKASGGTNYREHLIRLPHLYGSKAPTYQSPHWKAPNVIAHVRMQDMTPPEPKTGATGLKLAQHHNVAVDELGSGSLEPAVKAGVITPTEAGVYARAKRWTSSSYHGEPSPSVKTLHVDELQSDWGQDARKKGTSTSEADIEALKERAAGAQRAQDQAYDRLRAQGLDPDEIRTHPNYTSMRDLVDQYNARVEEAKKVKPVPTGPYIGNTQGWLDLSLKHVLNEAALGGYGRVQFANGAENADRYGMRQHFDSLHYDPAGKRLIGMFNRHSKLHQENVEPGDLPDIVGGETAKRLLTAPLALHSRIADEYARYGGDPAPVQTLEEPGLTIGGEGMKAFYDNIVPKSAMKLVQKHDPSITPDTQNGRFGFSLTPKARQSILGGQPAFASGGAVIDTTGNFAAKSQAAPTGPGGLPVGGGLSGGTGVPQASYATPLEGLPTDIKVPLTGQTLKTGPSAHIRAVAQEYMRQAGLPYSPPTRYAKVDPTRSKRIAAAFDEMKDDPFHPLVQASYAQLAKEAMAQYHAAVQHGFKAEFWDPETQDDPYHASPRLATEDVQKNNHMWVYPTHAGYGTNPDGTPRSATPEEIRRNPLLADSGERWNGQPVTVNDIFRAIHDYYGHAKEGLGFRADGEENAWRSHAAMFSPLARLAMTTETRGQNSWLNYGPHGDKNRTARTEDTMFAPQKIGIMPAWVHHEGAEDFISPKDQQKVVELTRGMSPSIAKALKLTGKRP